jgi:O-antigen/teichoic acid export membrane protein
MQKKILSSVSSQIIFILVNTFIGLTLVPITINMLGKIKYGVFELILSLIFIDIFLEFGLGSTLVKYIPELKHDIDKLRSFVWSYYYIKLFLTLLGFIVIVLIGYNFDVLFNLEGVKNIEEIKLATYIFGFGLIINSMTTFLDNFLKGLVYFGLTNTARIISNLLFFIIFYLYYMESNVYSIVYIALIWFVIRPLLLLFITVALIKYLNLSYILRPVKFKLKSLRDTLKYMYAMAYIVMVAQLYNRMPKILLGIVSGPIVVAFWGIMEKVKEPLLELENSMIRPLIPILSDKQNTVSMTEQKTFQAVRLHYFFMSFLGIMTITHIDLFIFLWLGEGFTEVADLVKIILFSFLFPKASVLLMMYYAKGKTKINTIFVTINTTISLLAGALVLIYTKNIELFAWTLTIILIIGSLFNILRYIKYFNISNSNFIKDSMLSPILIIISFFLIQKLFVEYINLDVLGLILSILVSILIYIGLFMVFMKSEDKQLLIRIIKKESYL